MSSITIETDTNHPSPFIRRVVIIQYSKDRYCAEAVSIHKESKKVIERSTVVWKLNDLIDKANDWVSYKEDYFY